MTSIVRFCFFLQFTLLIALFCLKTKQFIKKLSSTHFESILLSIFDLKYTCKIVLTEYCWTLYICLKRLIKALKMCKMLKEWHLKKTGTRYAQNVSSTGNTRQSIGKNSEKVKQSWTRPVNFDISFYVTFDHYTFFYKQSKI